MASRISYNGRTIGETGTYFTATLECADTIPTDDIVVYLENGGIIEYHGESTNIQPNKNVRIPCSGKYMSSDIIIKGPQAFKSFTVTSSNRDKIGYTNDIDTLNIPATFIDSDGVYCTVTRISSEAFEGCSNLVNISIPDTVSNIGEWAFSSCTNLKSITLPSMLTQLSEGIFDACCSLENVIIPESVTDIDEYAFYACTKLTNITFPESVTEIKEEAFSYCTNLRSITLPSNIKYIADKLFYRCTSLVDVNIPESVTEIRYGAFAYCESLESIIIPESTLSWGHSAFQNCTKLTNINIPKGKTTLSDYLFGNCTSLKNIVMPYDLERFSDIVFINCTGLEGITFENTSDKWGVLRCTNNVLGVVNKTKVASSVYFSENPVENLTLICDTYYSHDHDDGSSDVGDTWYEWFNLTRDPETWDKL